MGKDTGKIYKHSQYKLLNPSIKEPVISYYPFANITLYQINNNFSLFCY